MQLKSRASSKALGFENTRKPRLLTLFMKSTGANMNEDMYLGMETESISADPVIVEHIAQNIVAAIKECLIPNVTTQADILSAAFTVLNRILRDMQSSGEPEELQANAKELSRVLTSMLLEFGDCGTLN